MSDTVKIARELARTLELHPDRTVVADLDSDLDNAFTSLQDSAGAQRVPPGTPGLSEPADCGAVSVDRWESHLVDERVRTVVAAVAVGGTVAVVIDDPPQGQSPEKLAETLRPILDLKRARCHRLSGGASIIISGTRRRGLTGAKRKELRGLAHGLEPSLLVGRAGVSAEIVAAAKTALQRHGILKAKLTPQANLDKDRAADDLVWATGAQLVQRVGKTVVLYNPDVPLDPPVSKNPRRR